MAICKAIIVLYPPLMHSKFRHRRDILKVKAEPDIFEEGDLEGNSIRKI